MVQYTEMPECSTHFVKGMFGFELFHSLEF